MMSKIDDSWMMNLNVQQELSEMGIRVEHDRGQFVDCFCPKHEDPATSKSPSFSIATEADRGKPPGIFLCRGCDWTGDIVELYSHVNNLTRGAALSDLLTKYAPEDPRVAGGKKKRELPTEAWLKRAEEFFWADSRAQHDLMQVRAWSEAWCRNARVGLDMGKLVLPIMGISQNQLLNVRWRRWDQADMSKGPKTYGVAGRKPTLYPLWAVDRSRELIIVEGEMDVGALRSIGENAVTHLGGAKALDIEVFREILPKPSDATSIILCLDRDRPGRAAERLLRNQLWDYGFKEVKLIIAPHPYKDIEEYLRTFLAGDRPGAWRDLCAEATLFTGEVVLGDGIYVSDGRIVDEEGEELAPWTAKVLSHGRQRYQHNDSSSSYIFELTYKETHEEKKVVYEVGDSFRDAILAQCGPQWAILKRHEDKLFTAICKATGPSALQQDRGFIFGFEQRNRSVFWSPGFSFRKKGPFETKEEIAMEGDINVLKNLKLPYPDPDTVPLGMDLVLNHLFESHHPDVMGLMITSAFAAPIRRLVFPNDQSFNILIYGSSGCGKTSRAREVMNLFSGLITDDQQIASWRSSPKFIEEIMTRVGDSWMLVDEFRPQAMSLSARKEAIAILQGVAQGGGRQTLTADRALKGSGEGNCLLACTMEFLPTEDDSMLARSVLIPVPQIPVLAERWKVPHDKVMRNRDFLPYAMSGWIKWMFCNPEAGQVNAGRVMEDAVRWAEDLCREVVALVRGDWVNIPNSPRIFQRSVMLTAVWKGLLEFAVSPEIQAINVGRYEALIDQWSTEVLYSYFRTAFLEVDASGPVENFMSGLVAAIEAGDAVFHYRNGPKSKADQNNIYPKWAKTTAPVVGEIIPAWEGVMSESTKADEDHYVVRLKSSVTKCIGRNHGRQVQWREVKSQLEAYKILMPESVSTSMLNRAHITTRRGSQRLVPVIMGTGT